MGGRGGWGCVGVGNYNTTSVLVYLGIFGVQVHMGP